MAIEIQEARALNVQVGEDSLVIELVDGRSISVPIAWYPRLWYGTPDEQAKYSLIGDGKYIHWSELDEDLSIAGVLIGRRSGESSQSLRKWLTEHIK